LKKQADFTRFNYSTFVCLQKRLFGF